MRQSRASLAESSRRSSLLTLPGLATVPFTAPALRARLRRARKRVLASRPRFWLLFLLTNVTLALIVLLTLRQLTARTSSTASTGHTGRFARLALPFARRGGADGAARRRAADTPPSQRRPWFSRRASARSYRLTPLQHEVRNATRAMYRAYFRRCRGRDEYIPGRDDCADWYNVGLTTLDAADTLLLMGLDDEYTESRAWAERALNFSAIRGRVSTFELIIRALGGMLSAYELSGHPVWLRKSVDLGDRLLPFFAASRTGCPPMNVDFARDRRADGSCHVSASLSTPADAGTLQLEMRTLSALTGDARYAAAGDKCIASMLKHLPPRRLVPPAFDVESGKFRGTRFTIGGSVDSFYEMLVKSWVAGGRSASDTTLRDAFAAAVDAIYARLHAVSPGGLHFLGEQRGEKRPLRKQMDHLACFFPGVLAVGALHGLGGGMDATSSDAYMPRARRLARTCFEMTRASSVGLASEITEFDAEKPRPQTGHDTCKLRPEIAEALFYLARVDGAQAATYRAWGREMWEAMRVGAQVRGREQGVLGGMTDLLSGGGTGARADGEKLESFVLAETMKYLFLLFDERTGDDVPVPLDEWVFNTEAHPVRVRGERAEG